MIWNTASFFFSFKMQQNNMELIKRRGGSDRGIEDKKIIKKIKAKKFEEWKKDEEKPLSLLTLQKNVLTLKKLFCLILQKIVFNSSK